MGSSFINGTLNFYTNREFLVGTFIRLSSRYFSHLHFFKGRECFYWCYLSHFWREFFYWGAKKGYMFYYIRSVLNFLFNVARPAANVLATAKELVVEIELFMWGLPIPGELNVSFFTFASLLLFISTFWSRQGWQMIIGSCSTISIFLYIQLWELPTYFLFLSWQTSSSPKSINTIFLIKYTSRLDVLKSRTFHKYHAYVHISPWRSMGIQLLFHNP